MKLTFLEDGVLDYPRDGNNHKITLAISNPIPAGAIGDNLTLPFDLELHRELEQHIENCQECDEKLCSLGEKLVTDL